ncbi:MAG TPA: hypothetical protein PK781_07055 [Terrimesophilobacter sp.]|nr:hypothetical protein [Terrimesophilobacter sp.]HRQ00203.1 hypothetical protein [Terrimesophilobacter sp.]
MSDTWNPERGDSSPDNADRTGVHRGKERMSDEDFGADTLPMRPDDHVDTGLLKQDSTVLDQHSTTTRERIEGIREQTRLDLLGHDRDEIRDLLADRFRDAGIELRGDELDAMADAIFRDRSQLPEGTFEAYREQVDPE